MFGQQIEIGIAEELDLDRFHRVRREGRVRPDFALQDERLAVGIAFLFMATPLVGTNPIATKIGAGAAFLIMVALLLFDRSGDGTVSAESKGSYVGLGLLTQESTNIDQPKSQR